MAVNIVVAPVVSGTIAHTGNLEVLVTGLTATHNVRVNIYSSAGGTGFAGTAVTGAADANGGFGCEFAAGFNTNQTGWYIIAIEDTSAAGSPIVGVATFDVS